MSKNNAARKRYFANKRARLDELNKPANLKGNRPFSLKTMPRIPVPAKKNKNTNIKPILPENSEPVINENEQIVK